MSASDVDAFLGLLRGLSSGHLTICDDRGGEYSFGDVASGPSARVIVHDEGLYSRLLRDGELGLGQAYVDGWWDEADDRLVDLFAIILQNQLGKEFRGALGVKVRVIRHHISTLATRSRSRRNITSHYDLGNDFFRLFLDPTLAYSCGYQKGPAVSLLGRAHPRSGPAQGLLAELGDGGRTLDPHPSGRTAAVHDLRKEGG